MNDARTSTSICAVSDPAMTLDALVTRYKGDRVSGWQKLRYHTRQNHEFLLTRILATHGARTIASIRRRDIEEWHLDWSDDGRKVAMGHSFMSKLRTLFNYGASMLEDPDCIRMAMVLRGCKFAMGAPRKSFIQAQHAIAIRRQAHRIGYPSIALAQALQFEIVLRQRDVIGEWVPETECVESDLTWHGAKWHRGLLWDEIDGDLVLRHKTSKTRKDLEVDLTLAPMVMEEIDALPQYMRLSSGPVVICEATGLPWHASEFRRKWRLCADEAGVPRELFNMDSRSGGITEGTDAGIPIEFMSKAATHSDVATTMRYNRNDPKKIADALRQRAAYRQQIISQQG